MFLCIKFKFYCISTMYILNQQLKINIALLENIISAILNKSFQISELIICIPLHLFMKTFVQEYLSIDSDFRSSDHFNYLKPIWIVEIIGEIVCKRILRNVKYLIGRKGQNKRWPEVVIEKGKDLSRAVGPEKIKRNKYSLFHFFELSFIENSLQ